MRLLPIIFVLLILPGVAARAQDAGIDRLMSKRILTPKEAAYNLVLQLLRLHNEKKFDTVTLLIAYYHRNFGSSPELTPYLLVTDIANRTFKETLRYYPGDKVDSHHVDDSTYYEGSILSYYLLWYAHNFNYLSNGAYDDDVKEAYNKYYGFIVAEAKAAKSIRTLTPVEKWILDFLIDPEESRFRDLSGSEYNGSLLQRAWDKYHEEVPDIGGFGLSLVSGVWSPTGRLGILGNHPYVGYTVGGKFDEHFMLDLRIDVRFLKTPNTYIVSVGNSKYVTNHFFGMNMGLDIGYELFRVRKHELDVIGGVAFEYFQGLNADFIENNNLQDDAGDFNTVNLNGGLSYKLYISSKRTRTKERFGYVALQGRYNWLFFNGNSGSDLSGGAWTIGLAFGYYSRNRTEYNIYY